MAAEAPQIVPNLIGEARRPRADVAPGLLVSLLLHGLFALFVLFVVINRTPEKPKVQIPFIPVDVVELSEQTTGPPAPKQAPAPQQKARRGPAAAPRPRAVSPRAIHPPKDELEARLRALSRLRQPDSDLAIDNEGASTMAATSNGASPGPAAYSVRDYVRAQVLRRWNLNLAETAGRNIAIPMHVTLSRKGMVISIEIRNRARYATDAIFRDVSISARNAVLLSQPFKLPDNAPRGALDFTLELNPRDMLR